MNDRRDTIARIQAASPEAAAALAEFAKVFAPAGRADDDALRRFADELERAKQ